MPSKKKSKKPEIDYDAFYKRINKQRKMDSSYTFKGKVFASSAVACELAMRYQFEGVEQQNNDPWHGREAKIGDAIHEDIQRDLKHKYYNKVLIEEVFPFEIDGSIIKCKIDAILNNVLIMEFKTVDGSKKGKSVEKAHRAQVQFYMGVTGIKKSLISYFDRQAGMHINSFEVEFVQEEFDEIVEHFTRVIRNEKLVADKSSCFFCTYKYQCSEWK